MRNVQYQLSNGDWIDCEGRTDEFLTRCEQNNGIDAEGKIVPAFRATRLLTRDEVIKVLESGRELRNDPADWYSNCRMAPQPKAERQPDYPEGRKLDCGHTVYWKREVMNASRGTACPDCYDRMSD